MKKLIFFIVALCLTVNAYSGVFTSTGGGAWDNAAIWSYVRDSDGIPDANDTVTISLNHTVTNSITSACRRLTVTGTLSSSAAMVLSIYGDYIVNGTESGSGAIVFYSWYANGISGSGTFGTNVKYTFAAGSSEVIAANTTIVKNVAVGIASATVTNLGNVTLTIVNTNAGATWINSTNSSLTLKNTDFMLGRTFTANATGNTVSLNYSGGSVPNTTAGYYNLSLVSSVAGSKNIKMTTTVANNLTINATNTLNSNGYDLLIGGNWVNNGSFTQDTRTVTFNGTGVQSIGGSTSTTFYNLTKSAAGTTTLAINTVVSNLLTLSGGILSTSTFGLTGTGGFTQTNGELTMAKLAVTLPELAGAYAISGGKVTFNGAGAQTVKPVTYFDVDISGSGTKTAGGALDVNGALTISSTLDMSAASNYALSCAGNFVNNGSFLARSGTVTFDGTSTVSGSTTTTFNNVTISGTLTGHATTMNVAGNWSNGGTYTHNSGTVVFNGTTTISGTSTTGFNNVTISGTLTGHATAMNVAGNWSNGGTYTHNSGTVVFNGTSTVSGASTTTFNDVTISGTLTGHATSMNVAGNWSNGGTYTHNSGTVVFNGTSTVSGASTTTFNNVTISGTLTGHATSMNVAGNWSNGGTYTHNSGTILFNGTTTVSGASTTTFNNVTITGTLTAHAISMNVAGNWVNAGTFNHNNGTIVFNGNTSVNGISINTFNNLTITGTLTSFPGNMNLIGNFANNGVFNHNSGTLTFNGAGVVAQSISSTGASTFYGLTINNTGGGVILSSGSYLLDDVLTLSNGTLNVNSRSFTMVATPAKYSRIAPVTGTGAVSNATTFNVQRYVSARDTTWSDMASPNRGTMANWDANLYFSYTHNPVTYNPFSNVVKYNEALHRYEGVSAGTVLTPGKGFEIFLTDDALFSAFTPGNLTTTGTPNISQPAITLSYTAGAGVYKGQNLIGNPYASAVTISSMTFTNASSTIDVFDYTIQNYQALSGASVIGPGQGFWAYATSAGASVTIPETAKSANQTTNLRSTENENVEPFMTLKLSSADNSHTMAHIFKVASSENALDGWDDTDHLFRKSHNKSAPSITSNVEDKNLAINTFNSSHDKYSIPLSTQAGVSGLYQIEVGGLEYMNQFRYIALEDKLLNKMIDLKANQQYAFKLNTTDNTERFILHFNKNNQPVVVTNNNSNIFENQIEVLPSLQGNIINFNLSETTNTNISVNNILGQPITEAIVIDANNQSVNVSLPEGFHGMYIIRIESEKGSINKKFVKK